METDTAIALIHTILDIGPCCMCRTTENVVNLIMLKRLGPVPGHGWGCVICNLPANGAFATLCTSCLPLYTKDRSLLRRVCRGYPTEGRVPIVELSPAMFDHDEEAHRKHTPPCGP